MNYHERLQKERERLALDAAQRCMRELGFVAVMFPEIDRDLPAGWPLNNFAGYPLPDPWCLVVERPSDHGDWNNQYMALFGKPEPRPESPEERYYRCRLVKGPTERRDT